jgi:hypothetical protein
MSKNSATISPPRGSTTFRAFAICHARDVAGSWLSSVEQRPKNASGPIPSSIASTTCTPMISSNVAHGSRLISAVIGRPFRWLVQHWYPGQFDQYVK